MRKLQNTIVLILVFLLCISCSLVEGTPIGVELPAEHFNDYFTVKPIEELNNSETSQGIWLNAENHSEFEILFDTRNWVSIYTIDGSPVADKVSNQFSQLILSPMGEVHDKAPIFVLPDIETERTSVVLKIVLSGTIVNASEVSMNEKRVYAIVEVEFSPGQ